MKTIILYLHALLSTLGYAYAQNGRSTHFKSINTVGLLMGENGGEFTLQSINGIAFGSYYSGLGVAVDNYGYRSIPLFIDVRKHFGHHTVQPLMYADMGLNLPLRTSYLPEKWSNGMDAYKLYNTLYGEAGIGISKNLGNKTNFLLAIGFSYKHFSYLQQNQNFPLWIDFRSPAIQYDFYYRRLALKMGISF